MKIKFGILTLALIAAPAFAAEYTLDLKPEYTKINFTLADALHTVHGTFAVKRGSMDFNTATGAASGQVVVDVTSGNSGSDARDSRMHANVLESKKYPEAVFVPDHILGTLNIPGSSTAKVHGMFTIHGATHEITMDVQTMGTSERLRATLTFEIPYVAWGMKDPSNFLLKVNKVVQMSIETVATLQAH